MYAYAYARTHVCIHICMYTHTYTHTYACVSVCMYCVCSINHDYDSVGSRLTSLAQSQVRGGMGREKGQEQSRLLGGHVVREPETLPTVSLVIPFFG